VNVQFPVTLALSAARDLYQLADELARARVAARWQQDRINCARAAADEVKNDGWFENQYERLAGEDEFPPPSNPKTPKHPYFHGSGAKYAALGP